MQPPLVWIRSHTAAVDLINVRINMQLHRMGYKTIDQLWYYSWALATTYEESVELAIKCEEEEEETERQQYRKSFLLPPRLLELLVPLCHVWCGIQRLCSFGSRILCQTWLAERSGRGSAQVITMKYP